MSAGPESSTLVVLGAGSWGTALAIQLARLSRPTVLWGRDPAHVAALARQRCNERYLPQAEVPDSLLIQAGRAAAGEFSRRFAQRGRARCSRALRAGCAHRGSESRIAFAAAGNRAASRR